MNDDAINDAVRGEGAAIFEDFSSEYKLCLLGGDASGCCDLGTQIVDKGGVGGGEGDGERFSGGLFDADGNAHDVKEV